MTEEILTPACPETGLAVAPADRAAVEALTLHPRRTRPQLVVPEGEHDWLLRSDRQAAFPVVDGVPIMMVPESFVTDAEAHHVLNLGEARYAESYEERAFYTGEAERHPIATHPGVSVTAIREIAHLPAAERGRYPFPLTRWVTAIYDCTAGGEAARHIAPVEDRTVLQLGGTGSEAVKLLLAGAAKAWLLTPVLAEAQFARRLAEHVGVGDRLECAVGIGEEMPFRDGSFDIVYSGGSLHHTVTALAFAEAERVLRPGGRFAAVDPWRAPLYSFGTRLLGKREVEVYCRPIDRERLHGIGVFGWYRISLHGALLRYPLIALQKFGVQPGLATVWRLLRLDDRIASALHLRRYGSSVAILATK